MEIVLIRHTSVEAQGICYGSFDVPLASSFEEELATYGSRLGHLHFDAVYASPAKRCKALAQGLIKNPLHFDERLRELHFGNWEGQTWAQLQSPELDAWMADWTMLAPPNGETVGQLYARACSFLETLTLQHKLSHKILCVTHSGIIRSMRCMALGLPLSQLFHWKLGFGQVHQLFYENQQWRFVDEAY